MNYVEYRASQRWDTGFWSIVLVHYILNETSYLVAELTAGSPAFTFGNPRWPFELHGSITVNAIDDASETATITTVYNEGMALPAAGPAFSVFGSELRGGAEHITGVSSVLDHMTMEEAHAFHDCTAKQRGAAV